jgi:hypothetical protein
MPLGIGGGRDIHRAGDGGMVRCRVADAGSEAEK